VPAEETEDAMLDAFIIEEIKRREREEERRERRSRIELPLPEPPPRRQDHRRDRKNEDAPQRGVLIIDYSEPPLSTG
jgi:hypothetical protein